MNDVYLRIDDLCREKSIDITTMCKEALVSRAALSEFKMGRTKKLSTDTLTKIAAYFNVAVDYLLTGEESTQKEKAPAKAEIAIDDAVKFALFGDAKDEITEDDMDDVRAFAQFVAERKRKKDEKSN